MSAPHGSDVDQAVVHRLHPDDLSAIVCAVTEALPASPWLDAEEAAAHLRCGKRRVYDLVQQGRIPHRREGARLLFRADELDAWLDSGAAADADTPLTRPTKSLQMEGF